MFPSHHHTGNSSVSSGFDKDIKCFPGNHRMGLKSIKYWVLLKRLYLFLTSFLWPLPLMLFFLSCFQDRLVLPSIPQKDLLAVIRNSPSQLWLHGTQELISPRTVPGCLCAGIWAVHHRRCPSGSSHGPQQHCSPGWWCHPPAKKRQITCDKLYLPSQISSYH